MGLTRRRAIAVTGTLLAAGGCQMPAVDATPYEGTDRIYTCSYDSTAFALEDEGETVTEAWYESGFVGQTRDILPDADGNIVATDNRGLHKWDQRADGLAYRWGYDRIRGSIRGIAVDRDNDYYVGSWTANQGFHKVVETAEGIPEQAWVYSWPDDTGLITAATDLQKRIALALKTGSVHLIVGVEDEPELQWEWQTESNAIVREVLWDRAGDLYVASEDHHLYKLRAVDGDPELLWSYDAGNMLFGAAVTPDDDIYVGTNDGQVHHLRDDSGEPELQWMYQHTDYEGTAPTDRYFWGGLVHQVAVRPDREQDAIYSCAYGENTVHKIAVDDGTPRMVWEHDGHRNNVREVRVHGDYVGTTPEVWGLD